jgi:D-aspartate ligase
VTPAPPPVVVLGGEAIAVSVARSLAPRGVAVHALGVAEDPVRWSRWCREFVDLGAGAGVAERWRQWFEAGHAPAGAVVLPCNDDALEFVARNRGALERLGLRPMEAGDDGVLAMLDKDRTYAIAGEAGVPAPRTIVVRSGDELRAAVDELGWPAALKPLQSHLFAHHYGLTRKVLLADDADGLVRAFEQAAALGVPMGVTEIVPGGDDAFYSYYSYLDEHGEPLLHVTKRKLRQYPPRFGLGTLHATSWDPDVAELGLRFFRAARLRGLACVEFKKDARTGRLRLIEVNHRLTLATELLRRAGADLPWFVYARAAGLPTPEVRCRPGVTLWAPGRDLRAYLARRADRDLPFGAWVRSVARPQAFLLGSLSDPRPAAATAALTARRGLRRLAKRRPARPLSARDEVDHAGAGEPLERGAGLGVGRGLGDAAPPVDPVQQGELVLAEHDRRAVEDPRL